MNSKMVIFMLLSIQLGAVVVGSTSSNQLVTSECVFNKTNQFMLCNT